MNKVLYGACVALLAQTHTAHAEYTVNVRGTDYPLTALMDSCVNANGGGDAQLRCFVALTDLVKEQSATIPATDLPATDALAALKAVAEYQDAESGLLIQGTGCEIHILYYNNFYHMSRRNMTSLDVFEARFDAEQINIDQTMRSRLDNTAQATGLMQLGATATFRGGAALESTQMNFPAITANTSVADYAASVASQLAPSEDQSFDFVLVHPAKAQASPDIWGAFGSFLTACQQ